MQNNLFFDDLIVENVRLGGGGIVIDTDGSLIDRILKKVPSSRENVYVLDPSDNGYPFGLNLFELEEKEPLAKQKEISKIADKFIEIMKESFGAESIGPSVADLFRMSSFAVLEYVEDVGLLEMLMMFTSEPFRCRIIPFLSNPIVKDYWKDMFPTLCMNKNFTMNNLNAPLARIRRFIANPVLANIICQSKTSVNIKNVMEEGGLILAKFNQEALGAEEVSLLVSILKAKMEIVLKNKYQTCSYLDAKGNLVSYTPSIANGVYNANPMKTIQKSREKIGMEKEAITREITARLQHLKYTEHF